MTWRILLSREGVDLPTTSEIDLVFFDLLWTFQEKKEDLFFSYCKNKHITHYINTDPQEVGRKIYQKYFNSPEQIKKYYEEGKIFINEFTDLTQKWKNNLTRENLLSAFTDFREQFKRVCYIYSITSWISIEIWQNDFESLISNLIQKNGLQKMQEKINNCIYKPWKKTALLEIQDKINEGKDITEISQEYQFLRSWVVIWYRELTKEWFENLKIKEKDEESLSKEEVIKILKPNSKEEKFIELAPFIVFFKDWRDDLRRKFAYSWSFLFQRISEEFKVNFNDLGYLTLDEIESSLKEGLFKLEVIERRKEHGCIITSDGVKLKVKVIDGELPGKYFEVINSLNKEIRDNTLKGISAQIGIAKGPVRIVRSYHDIKKVCEGDIIVANTTHPDYLPAMKKAAAFVTNEGGSICHAAIVARELKKPCIVGTKNATKILNENDIIEVNADKGIVRVLEK